MRGRRHGQRHDSREALSFAGRLARRLIVLAAVVLVGLAVLGKLPSGTERSSLVVRAATGAAAGLLIIGVVWRSMRSLTAVPPAPPPKIDAKPADVVYECPVCGTRVRLEVAATGKPPKHCGEEMEAEVSS